MVWYMEKLNQVWEKLSLNGLLHGEAESDLGETESEPGLVHGEAESGLGETESGWLWYMEKLNQVWEKLSLDGYGTWSSCIRFGRN